MEMKDTAAFQRAGSLGIAFRVAFVVFVQCIVRATNTFSYYTLDYTYSLFQVSYTLCNAI